MAKGPYGDLPASAFWRSAIVEAECPSDVYVKKYLITKADRLMTAGSCFAQKIGAALSVSGFQVIDAEPPPKGLPRWRHGTYGYGLYSARYGNIYTTLQLLQLAREALRVKDLDVIAWKKNDRYVDALRPSIEPYGFQSLAELRAHREHHLDRVRYCLLEMDVLIFTLGLTEAWRHRPSGRILPVAPGVITDNVQLDEYEFINFGYHDNLRYLKRFLRLVERYREKQSPLRLVLSVSPVPLTATASSRHVLVANTYSKAVLRAVAEELFLNNPNVDYVPSYEMVTNPRQLSRHYCGNWRSISDEGVAAAMSVFLEQHHLDRCGEDVAPLDGVRQSSGELSFEGRQAVICEEQLLDLE